MYNYNKYCVFGVFYMFGIIRGVYLYFVNFIVLLSVYYFYFVYEDLSF